MMPKALPPSSGPVSVLLLPRAGCSALAGWDYSCLPSPSRAEQGQPAPLHDQAPLALPARLGKHPHPWPLATHAPHSTFRERMLSKPHSMMFGQAEVNSILLPWKFSWSYTVIWNGERAAELGTARQRPQAIQRLFETEGRAPFGKEPAEAAPGTPLGWDAAPHVSAHPCTAGPTAPCLGVGGVSRRPPLRSPAHPCGDQFPGQRCRPERGAELFWDRRVAGLWLAVLPASAPNALGQRGLTGKGRGGTPRGAAADALLSRNSSRLRQGAPACARASPLPLGSLLKVCPQSCCQTPRGCFPPCSAMPTALFAALVPAPAHPASLPAPTGEGE